MKPKNYRETDCCLYCKYCKWVDDWTIRSPENVCTLNDDYPIDDSVIYVCDDYEEEE